MSLRIGIDIGSTTVKVVVLDEQNKLLFRSYERHFSKVREKACEILSSIAPRFSGQDIRLVITGSAGLGVAKASGIDFVQEVYATAAAVNEYIPDTDAVIELVDTLAARYADRLGYRRAVVLGQALAALGLLLLGTLPYVLENTFAAILISTAVSAMGCAVSGAVSAACPLRAGSFTSAMFLYPFPQSFPLCA